MAYASASGVTPYVHTGLGSATPSRSTACRRDPRRRRTQPSPQLLSPPSPPPSPDPLAGDHLQLASVAVSAARRDSASSHPGRAHFSPPRRTCVCARHTAAPPALPHVEHLHPDCRLAVFDEIPIRHLTRLSFRHASKAASASRPGPIFLPISPN
jgi:hypothetical protein